MLLCARRKGLPSSGRRPRGASSQQLHAGLSGLPHQELV